MQDQQQHQKYRSQKAKAAWEVLKRVCKLPAKGKRTLVTQQLLPILTYSCELYLFCSVQQSRRLVNGSILTDGSTHPPIAHRSPFARTIHQSLHNIRIFFFEVYTSFPLKGEPVAMRRIIYGCAYEKEKICAGGGQKHGATYNRANKADRHNDPYRHKNPYRNKNPYKHKNPWLAANFVIYDAIHS